jgi:ribosomal protein L11 methyltransferase
VSALVREVRVDVPAAHEAAALAAVYGLGVQGVQVQDADTGAPAGRVRILAWLAPTDAVAAAVRRLADELGSDACVDWQDVPAAWEAGDAAGALGSSRFSVAAPGAPGGHDTLVLDPSLAFGDGRHPTTVLCVEALERHVHRGASVLDVGTGSGILAIVAARLGAHPVVACDVDPLAVFAARAHVAANAVQVDVRDTLPDGRFALVICNLYEAPLIGLLPTLAARVAPGGRLLVSGFVAEAVDRIVVAAGMRAEAPRVREGWALVELSGG